jgi:hypothetical protein
MLKSLFRRLLGIPKPQFSADEALRLVQTECSNRGIPIGEPLVIEQLKTWQIWIDRNRKGSPMVIVDQQSGEILKFSQLPR